jgi:DNA polymerase III subunit gamma/tau
MVYYRKYRPQTLGQLIGQDNIKETLLKAFQAGKLSHAYLFCGPRGTGKTSTARILAKLVNCEVLEGEKPCNKCSFCLSITDGSNLDLVEIDAASNRGIDDIRELREKVKLSPTSAKKKIYIIDEVHMLTNEAFNALLKTLEEPPEHVLFILATTELNKIPQTILSRVQKLDFKLATQTDLLEALKRVVDEEKLDIEDEALKLIAKRAEGSFRDCLKLLDQLASMGEKITLLSVEEALKSGQSEDVFALLESLAKKDTTLGLEIIKAQIEKGVNLKEFTQSLLENLRYVLFIKNGATKLVEAELGVEAFAKLAELSSKFSDQKTTQIINSLLESLEKLKFTSIPSLPLEIAVVESCNGSIPRVESVSEIQLKGNSETIKLTQVVQENIRNPEMNSGSGIPKLVLSDELILTDDVMNQDMATLKDKWQFVLETIKPYNFSLEALLKQAKLLSCNEGIVMLEVPYSFHQRILEAPKSRDLLESVLTDVLGKTARVSCVLGKRPVRVEEIANIELAQDDEIIKVAAEIFNSEG